ncbi:S-layer homology domain-containing protein [Halobacillus sp. BBL2006]|uniref:S-layer homology domain-containing protein n=1 Tax=Halobacillus sp. BBL2006 TaxID=1543706 RepID=UPI000689435A|nr:S-layer homology domain-containing protein [Halobacillus sp. BBL2006]
MTVLSSIAVFSSTYVQAEENVEQECNYEVKTGENPDYQMTNCLLTEAAIKYDVPAEIVKAIAEQESGWKQFDENGDPLTSVDGGIGIMQLTNQPSFNQEKLKNDISYNIEAGVKILSDNFERNDLPVINGADRNVIEHWYFAILAYNGTKPINSPVKQSTGDKNEEAYQEKIFASINQSVGYDLTELKFDAEDFEYDSESDQNIEFKKDQYHFLLPFTKTKHLLKEGQTIGSTVDLNIRKEPSTKAQKVGTLKEGQLATVTGPAQYETSGIQNQFVFYPVQLENGIEGYVASAYLRNKFKDLPTDNYSVEAIEYLYDMNILKGYSEDEFGYKDPLKRKNTALFLVRAENISLANRPDPGFVDVPKSSDFYDEVAALADEGIFKGDNNNRFNLDSYLKRREMAVLLQRVYQFPEASETEPFVDVKDGDWYQDAVEKLYAAGITKGVSETEFGPDQRITREQFATFLARSINDEFR